MGGGHFLDLKRPEVLDFLFNFLPKEEWQEYQRVAKIRLPAGEIDHPIEANLWQLPLHHQVDYLESIARAGATGGVANPESFEPWITWKLGVRISEDYMLPYNRKIWSIPLDEIGTEWMHKLPSVSFRECLESCLSRVPGGTLSAHGRFLYPKRFGYGEVWRRMGDALGDQLRLGCPIERIDVEARVVNGFVEADWLVNTIPWPAWLGATALPTEVRDAIQKLQHVSIDVDHVAEDIHPAAHWLYEPSPAVSWHRALCRSNFFPGARGGWTETNARRAGSLTGWRHRNDYAYPIATHSRTGAMSRIVEWASARRIVPLGRWGKWEHMNSDVAVAEALALAGKLITA